MKQIICLSQTPWHGLPSRTVQLISRMKNHRILYFDPPPCKDGPETAHYRDEGQQVAKNITLLGTPPAGILNIGGLYRRKLASYIKKQMQAYAFEKPILWLTNPFDADLPDALPHSSVIYDCHESAAEPLTRKDDRRRAMTAKLTRRATVSLASSKSMRSMLLKWSGNVQLLANGVSLELFERSQDTNLSFPDDLFTVKNPIFGHIGAISEHIDLSLAEYVARARSDWSLVFIGEYQDSPETDALLALPNVYLLGKKPQKLLPTYLCRFNACLSLYKSSELSRDISPMKLYEYLAAGKPIVSTPQPEQVLDYSDVVYIAGTPEEYLESCRKASMERDAWKVRQRITYARTSSWDARVAELERKLMEIEIL